jgi:hypothetical protein
MSLGSAIIKVESTDRNGFGGGIGSKGEIEGTIGQRACLVKFPEKLGFKIIKEVTSLGAKLYFVAWRCFKLCWYLC